MSDASAVGGKTPRRPTPDPALQKLDRAGLGKNAKSATPPSAQTRSKIRVNRVERYELLAAARGLFLYQGKQKNLEHPANFHRTAKCAWVTHGSQVAVHKSLEHGSSFFSGLVTCASVWACPVCTAKIQERRRLEISDAIDWAYLNKLQPVMVTLTFPHYVWQILADLIKQQADALHRLRAGEPWKRIKDSIGYEGLIRSLELTLGKNGWHPHTHELWFVSASVKAEDLKATILKRWKNCCARAGLLDLSNGDQVKAFEEHAVDVKGWCNASEYLAKQDDSRHWGADRELAKGSTKEGRRKGKHPFGLLADAAEGDEKAGAQFIEYATAMAGKRQLFWSAGLKDAIGVIEKSEEEVIRDYQDKADILGKLDLSEWKLVREAGKRAEVLDAAESGGWPAVQALILSLTREKVKLLRPSLCQSLLHPHAVNITLRRRSAMQQEVMLSTEEKGLFERAGKSLFGPQFTDKVRDIVSAAPSPSADEELVYRVVQRDMPAHQWPAFQLMRDFGYAVREKASDPDEGEVLRVDGSILDLIMEAIKRVLEALLGVGDAGAPPAGPSRKARPTRQGSLLIEHDSRR